MIPRLLRVLLTLCYERRLDLRFTDFVSLRALVLPHMASRTYVFRELRAV